jgi:signal transduction histidine kinase
MVYYNRALGLADRIRNEHYKALAMIKIGYVESEKSNFGLVNKIFSGVYEKSKERGDTLAMVEALNGIGILNENINNLEKAVISYKLAIKLAEGARLNYEQAYVKHNLGNLYCFQGEDSLGFSYLMQALRFAQISGHKKLQTHANLNIGLYYKERGDFVSAEKHYRRSLHQARIDNSPPDLIPTLLNLVDVTITKKQYREAETYCQEALDICWKANLNDYKSVCYYGLARIKSETNKIDSAIAYTRLGVEWALKGKKNNFINEGYSLLAHYYEVNKNYDQALEYFKKYKKLSDSLNNDNYVSKIKYLNSQEESLEKKQKYEEEKNKNLQLEQKFERGRANMNLLIASAIVLVLLIVLTFLYFMTRMKRRSLINHRKTLIELNDKERSNMALNLHDEVGQILSILKNKQSKCKFSDESDMNELNNLVDEAIDKTRTIAFRFHPKFLEHVSINQAVNSLLADTEKNTGIVCLFEKSDDFDQLTLIDRVHIYRILQECVTNTIKHSGATSIRVDFIKENSRYHIIYRDNGKGLGKNHVKKFGFLSIEERVTALNGKLILNIKKPHSFHLEIYFPW